MSNACAQARASSHVARSASFGSASGPHS
jgi:hypothetical protein